MAEAPGGPIDIAALAFEAGVSVEDLDQECRECDLSDLAHLCDPWELVGHHLRLKEVDISAIKENYDSAEMRRLKALKKWRDTNLRPTYRVLIEALLRCDKTQQALAICKKAKDVHSSEGSVTSMSPSSLGDTAVQRRIKESLRELELMFSDVQRQFMSTAGLTLEDLKDCIATLRSFRPRSRASPPQILNSVSVQEFFFHLREYCNILSHDILDDLIKCLGDDKTKQKMGDFRTKWKDFSRKTRVKDILTNIMTTPSLFKQLEMNLGENWHEKTLEDLQANISNTNIEPPDYCTIM